MRIGLVLGGGGVVGVAWEIGVLAGLARQRSFDAAASAVIAGISAGAIVGTRVALGHDLEDLVAEQRAPFPVATRTPPNVRGAEPRSVVPDEIMAIITSTEGTHETRGAAIGRLALRANVAVTDDAFVGTIRTLIGDGDWPATDLRITTVDCQSGRTVLWSRFDGIELARAVATSCAVPGWFPAVAHAGRHYTDAPRGDFCTSLVADAKLDALVFIGPYVANDPGMSEVPGLRELTDSGVAVVEIRGGERAAEVIQDLMDPTRRAVAVAIGLEDGASHAAAVSAACRA